jgi:hypothetical protein
MSEPVESGNSRVGVGSILVGLLMTALPACAVLFIPAAIIDTQALLNGFGGEPPALTRFVLSHAAQVSLAQRVLAVAQVTALILLVLNRNVSARRLLLRIGIPSVVVTLAIVVALYLPVMSFGSTV